MPKFHYNSYNIFYREQGNGPVLIILPGNTASSAAHEGELSYFADGFRTAALDFLGTGQSDRLIKDYYGETQAWFEDRAKQTAALIEHLGSKNACIVGCSGGGTITLLTAVLYPQQVRSLIADSCPAIFTRQMFISNVLRERQLRSPEQIQFWEYCNGPDWEDVVRQDTEMLDRFSAAGGDCFQGRLHDISCPVLLTASRKDSALPGITDQVSLMANQIPECSVYLHDDGDHPFMWTEQEEFRRLADRFLRQSN